MYKELFTYSYVICKHRINVTKGLCSDVSLPGIEQPSSFIYLLKQQQQQTNKFFCEICHRRGYEVKVQ